MHRTAQALGSRWLVVMLALSGCGGPPEAGDVVSTEGPILNGTPVGTDAVGTPKISNTASGGTCTGTLLRDRWVLTAYHCVTAGGGLKEVPTTPGNLSATVGSTTAVASELFFPPNPSGQIAQYDAALLKLGSALPAPAGHAVPWEVRIYGGTSGSLVGNTYFCQGWGINTCGSTQTSLRWANLRVAAAETDGFRIDVSPSGQLTAKGDSGASCYQIANGRYHAIGVNSYGECGQWSHFTGADTMRDWVSATMDRVGRLDLSNGQFQVKEGGLSHGWVASYAGAFLASIAGPRVAMIRQSDEHCLVKEGDFSNNWVDQGFSGVVRCLVDGNRIGVLTQDGVFRVKEGSLSSTGWVTQSSSVASAVLAGSRIGVVSNGHFYVKDGGLSASFVDVHSNVVGAALSGTRMGVLTTSGTFRVREGTPSPFGWVQQDTAVSQIALSGNRIGAVKNDGRFLVREGAVSPVGGWVQQAANVQQGLLSGKRIGVVANEGSLSSPAYRYSVKEGALDALWVIQSSTNSVGFIGVLPNK